MGPAVRTPAEGATGPRKRSGTKDRAGKGPLESPAARERLRHRRSKAQPRDRSAEISQVTRQRGATSTPAPREPRAVRREAAWPIHRDRSRPGTPPPAAGNPARALHRARAAAWCPSRVIYAGAVPGRHHGRAHRTAAPRAALFDVSHMGQASCAGPTAAAALERLSPGDDRGPEAGPAALHAAAERGGRHPRRPDGAPISANRRCSWCSTPAARTWTPATLRAVLPAGIALEMLDRTARCWRCRGPAAGVAGAALPAGSARCPSWAWPRPPCAGIPRLDRRSGYTGEDGVRDLGAAADAAAAGRPRSLEEPEVAARRPRRARLACGWKRGCACTGSDMDETTTPVEAGLTWTIGKRRRMAGTSPAPAACADELDERPHAAARRLRRRGPRAGPRRVRRWRRTARRWARSPRGGFGPTSAAPVAMGYVRRDLAADGTALDLMVRGKAPAGPRRPHCPSSPTATHADRSADA